MLRSMSWSSDLKSVFVLELLYAAASVSKLLLACKEWVALTADVYSHLVLCGESRECIPTCASNFTFLVIRMDSFLHVGTSFYLYIMKRFSCLTTARLVYHLNCAIARVLRIFFCPAAAAYPEDYDVEYHEVCHSENQSHEAQHIALCRKSDEYQDRCSQQYAEARSDD